MSVESLKTSGFAASGRAAVMVKHSKDPHFANALSMRIWPRNVVPMVASSKRRLALSLWMSTGRQKSFGDFVERRVLFDYEKYYRSLSLPHSPASMKLAQ